MPSIGMLGGAHLHEHAASTGDGHDRRQRGDCGGVRSGGGQTIVRHTCSLLLGLFSFCFLASASFLAWSAFCWAACCFLLPPRPSSGFGFGLLRGGKLLVGRLLVGELGIIVRLGFLVRLVGLGLRLVRLVELRLGVGQLRVRLLEVLLGVLQTLDGVPGVVEPAGGRVEVVLRLRVCGLGVGDGLVGGLDLLVGGFNLRVGNGLGFKRGLLGLLGLGLGRLGVGQVGQASSCPCWPA